MTDEPKKAVLLMDAGAYVNNNELVRMIGERFDLSAIHVEGRFRTVTRIELLRQEGVVFFKLFRKKQLYARNAVLIAGSGHYAALVAARIFSLFRREPRVFVFNLYLHGMGNKKLVRAALARLLSDNVAIVAQSETDERFFRALSERVEIALVPYGQGDIKGVAVEDTKLGDYIFSGGYSNRDYERLLVCAARMPHVKFVIACSQHNHLNAAPPGNVVIHRDVPAIDFHRMLAGSRLVVVPLAEDVGASGQMVTLAAMQLGKALVVPDLSSTAQYVEAGRTGITYEHRSTDALCAVLQALFHSDDETLRELGVAARRRYDESFTLSAFNNSLVSALRRFCLTTADAV